MQPNVRELHRFAKGRGWKISRLNGGHYSFVNPEIPGFKLTSSATPSDYRGILNQRALLLKAEREAGIFVDRHAPKKKGRRRGRKPTENFPAAPGTDRAGKPVMAYQATCSDCQKTGMEILRGHNHKPSKVARAFRAKGWSAYTWRTEDRCVACANGKTDEATMIEPMAPEADLTEAKALQTQSFGAKRAVYEALRMAYVSPEFGYREGESDATIASVCEVPEQVVANMRGEMFGPAHSDRTPVERMLVMQKHALLAIGERVKDIADSIDRTLAELRKN